MFASLTNADGEEASPATLWKSTGVYWACNKLTSGSILSRVLVGNEQLTMKTMGKTPASIN
jgi:hypothetical protein